MAIFVADISVRSEILQISLLRRLRESSEGLADFLKSSERMRSATVDSSEMFYAVVGLPLTEVQQKSILPKILVPKKKYSVR